MNELKCHNDLINATFKGFNACDLDMLMTLCTKCQNEETKTLNLSFLELKKIMCLEKNFTNAEFIKALMSMNKKLLSLNFWLSTEEKTVQFNLFNDFTIYHKDNSLEVGINKKFSYLINKLTGNFTLFELEEFVTLKSTYSKECYRRLKKFRNTGYWKVAIDDFREYLDIPVSYRISEINKKVLFHINKELPSYFKNLKINKIKSSAKGNPVTHLEFIFTPDKRTSKVIDINKDNKQIEQADNIQSLIKNIVNVDISPSVANDIYNKIKDKENYIEYLKEICEYSKNQKDISNFNAWILKMVDVYERPIKNSKGSNFNNFSQRNNNYENLEKDLLGWINAEK